MPEKKKLTVRDDANVAEVYANRVVGISFDGTPATVTMGASRYTPETTNEPITEREPTVHVTARLVLTPGAMADLIDTLSRFRSRLAERQVAPKRKKAH